MQYTTASTSTGENNTLLLKAHLVAFSVLWMWTLFYTSDISNWVIVNVLTVVFLGTNYLGTQGDPWDAQKDMAMAFSGAILALVMTSSVKEVRGR